MSSKNKVLIADDVLEARELMKAIVISTGFECVEAATGFEALNLIKADQEIGLALLDINIPLIDGISLLQRLAPIKQGRNLKLCLVTGKRDADVVRTAIAAGCDDYIVKPVEIKVVKRKIERLMGKQTEDLKYASTPCDFKADLANTPFKMQINLTSLSEAGCSISASFALEVDQMFQFNCPALSELCAWPYPFTCKIASAEAKDGVHTATALFVGFQEAQTQKIRAFVINPKPKAEKSIK